MNIEQLIATFLYGFFFYLLYHMHFLSLRDSNMDINRNTLKRINGLKTLAFTLLISITSSTLSAQEQNENLAATASDIKVGLTPAVTVDNIEEIYRNFPTNTRWENLDVSENVYQSPFQMSLFSPQNGEDGARLWSQTKAIFGYGFGVIGLIALLPENISNWDKENGILGKWESNVKDGPVWDRDTLALNFIGHPYFGGVYYQVARKSGYRQWDAFLYSALMSTFYWEFGIEAFAETPSIQDLVITPVLGWVYGEWAFNTEMDIRDQGGTVFGSDALGSTALFLLDPVDAMSVGVNNLFGKEVIKAGTGLVTFNTVPVNNSGETENQIQLSMTLQLGDGSNYSPKKINRAYRYKDPIDRGIIGLSYGAGYVQLDDSWLADNDITHEYSLGLYFTREYSARLSYSGAKLYRDDSADKINYENYSVDGQYYFNTEQDIRPYLTAGFGEVMWEKDYDIKTFHVNAGAGIHYKINKNFALQLGLRHYYSTNTKTSDNNISTRLIYFIGNGER